jgi:hypothetical protein
MEEEKEEKDSVFQLLLLSSFLMMRKSKTEVDSLITDDGHDASAICTAQTLMRRLKGRILATRPSIHLKFFTYYVPTSPLARSLLLLLLES